MKKASKYLVFIFFESLLIILVIVLALKIKNHHAGKVKGAQYITEIKKEDLVFDTEDNTLKYFYKLASLELTLGVSSKVL
jgi:hypothetical protein